MLAGWAIWCYAPNHVKKLEPRKSGGPGIPMSISMSRGGANTVVNGGSKNTRILFGKRIPDPVAGRSDKVRAKSA